MREYLAQAAHGTLPNGLVRPAATDDDANWFDGIPGERLAIRITSAASGGRCTLLESVAAPGCAAPLHRHQEIEVFHVIDGRPTFRVGDDMFDAPSGSIVLIPALVPHAWINDTPAAQRMIALFAPGGIEALFTRIAGLSPEEVAAIAAEYGTEVLGPPLAPRSRPATTAALVLR